MDHVLTPFVVNAFYFCDKDGKTDYVQSRKPLPVDERTPGFGMLEFRDIVAENCQVAAAWITGLPERKISELVFDDVKISFDPDAKEGVPAMASGVEAMASSPRTSKGSCFARSRWRARTATSLCSTMSTRLSTSSFLPAACSFAYRGCHAIELLCTIPPSRGERTHEAPDVLGI